MKISLTSILESKLRNWLFKRMKGKRRGNNGDVLINDFFFYFSVLFVLSLIVSLIMIIAFLFYLSFNIILRVSRSA